MFNWLLKPIRKIGQDKINTPTPVPKSNTVTEILGLCDIDSICQDVVLSRILVCLYTESIEQMFDYLVQGKDIGNHHQVAVSIGMYFRGLRIPPSESLRRLEKFLDGLERVPSKLDQDLKTLLKEIKKIDNKS